MSYVVGVKRPIIAIHEATCPVYVDREPDGVLWYGPYDTVDEANDKADREAHAQHEPSLPWVNIEYSTGCPLCRAQRALGRR